MVSKRKKRVLIFASGSANGGGSGLLHLIMMMIVDNLPIEIVAIVSNHAEGGVQLISERFQKTFVHFDDPKHDTHRYAEIVEEYRPDYILLSGWMFFVEMPDYLKWAKRILNIHPGPTKDAGGLGMYGHHVHEQIYQEFLEDKREATCVTMHFVVPSRAYPYDSGPKVFELRLPLLDGDTPDTIAARVNKFEHGWQWWVTRRVLTGEIRLVKDRKGGLIVKVPQWYKNEPYCPEDAVAA